MNPKIIKLKAERDKIADKVERLCVRMNALDAQIADLENTDIIGIVRAAGVSIDRLASLMSGISTDPVSAINNFTEMEEHNR